MKKAAALFVASALTLMLTLSACWDPEEQFPIWEDAEDEPETVDGISMEFTSRELLELDEEVLEDMSRDPYAEPYGEWWALHIDLRLEQEMSAPRAFSWRIDFWYNDAWHTVYRPKPRPIAPVARIYSPGTHDCIYYVPAQVLEKAGKYRLYQKDTGACIIVI